MKRKLTDKIVGTISYKMIRMEYLKVFLKDKYNVTPNMLYYKERRRVTSFSR